MCMKDKEKTGGIIKQPTEPKHEEKFSYGQKPDCYSECKQVAG